MNAKWTAVILVLGLVTASVGVGAAVPVDAEDETSAATDGEWKVCYVWIDGNFYCCERDSSTGDIKCEVPPRP